MTAYRGLLLVSLVVGISTLAPDALAQAVTGATVDAGILDKGGNQFWEQAAGWESILYKGSAGLFGGLAVIGFAWALIKYLTKGQYEFGSLQALFVNQMLWVGLCAVGMKSGPWLASMVVQGLGKLGQDAGGIGTMTPSTVLALGLEVAQLMLAQAREAAWFVPLSPMATMGMGLALFCLAAYGWMAAQLFIKLVEAAFVIYAGQVFFAFGVLPMFRMTIQGYISYALGVGASMMVQYLMIGTATKILANLIPALLNSQSSEGLIERFCLTAVTCATLAFAVHKVPAMAASMVSGSTTLNAGDAFAGAAAGAAAGVAVASAGAAVASGGSTAVVQGLAAATKIGSAGMKMATEQGSSGAGAALKGFGHATGAVAKEAGSTLAKKVGISSLGGNGFADRAAARMDTQKQAAPGKASSSPKSGDKTEEQGKSRNQEKTRSALESSDVPKGRPSGRTGLQPPQLPSDAAPQAAVQISLDSNDD